jgi:glyoxylate/hydroxypyruvate reductase
LDSRPIFLYVADPARGVEWARHFARKAPEFSFRVWPDVGEPARVQYIAAWQPPPELSAYPNLRLVFSVGAGVDQFDFVNLRETVPLVRMIEPGIVSAMVEYVTLGVLALHRDLPAYREQQRRRVWREIRVRPASDRRVGVLGLGVLGRAVLDKLVTFGFSCAGWSRSRHAIADVECFAGESELGKLLARTDILVCLLPLTPATRGLLDRERLAALPRGAALINVGRGAHVVNDDLLWALDEGGLAAALLDVCDPEPLPREHPFWSHPRIWLTPHVASMTQPETAVEAVLDNIRRHRAGEPLPGLVDRGRGY